jgi:GT2 family glycosyltransferase
VVVTVDGSTDGTWALLGDLAAPYSVTAVRGPERGRAAACNVGMETARGEIIVILDDDMQVVPEFVASHGRHHTPGSRLCVLGPAPIALDPSSPRAARYVQAKFDAHLARLAQAGHVFVPRDFYSGNASLRADVLREVGGFDESFVAYGNEDVDLSLRLQTAGVALRYDPVAVARQQYDKDLRHLLRDTFAKGSTTVSLARKHPDVFDHLRLAAPRESSDPWLAARAVLLGLTRRRPNLADTAFAAAALLEHLGLWRQPLFYRAILDYAFWSGVDAELRKSADDHVLEALAAELRRGPIRHRRRTR